MSWLRSRLASLVEALVPEEGAQRPSRRARNQPADWATPPVRGPLDPATRVRVIGSDRLRLGLAEVWTITDHRPDFTVVELAEGRAPKLERLQGAYVVWATVGGPDTDVANRAPDPDATLEPQPDPAVRYVGVRAPSLLAGADAVFVADPDQLEAWRAVAPDARLLPPAASGRILPARAREGVAVVATGPTPPELAGTITTVVARALRPLEESLVARRVDTTATLPRLISLAVDGGGTYAGARAAIGSAAVLADGLRRSRHDTWTVLDAAASATPVVSLDGLPQPVAVATAATEQGYRAELVARLQQPELRDREGLRLRREVLAGHTWAHRGEVIRAQVGRVASASERIETIHGERGLDTGLVPRPYSTTLQVGRVASASERIETIHGERGLDTGLVPRPYSTNLGGSTTRGSVSAIVPTNRTHELDNVLANIARQRHVDLELVLVLHGLDADSDELRKRAADAGVSQLQVVHAPSSYTLGACLNAGIDRAGGDYVAKMDDDNYYGAHYLTDLLDGFETSGAGIVGKWAHYVWLQSSGAVVLRYPDAEHTYQRRIQGGSMLFEGDLLRELRFGDLPRAVDSDILDRALADGVKVWSGDRFNYVSIRGVDRQAHTWTVEDATFLTASGRLEFYGDPRAHVEV